MPATPDLVIVGAAARDIDPEDRRGWRLGGGVSYGALLAARLGARVGALVGLDAEARTAWELELMRRAGAEVVEVPLEHGPVFLNRDTPAGRHQVCHSASDEIAPDELPRPWRSAPALQLAPVARELPDAWSDVPASGALVALAWQGLLRRLVAGEPVVELPAEPGPLLRRADVAGVSPEDLRAGGAPLEELLPNEGQQVAITVGEQGALHLRREPSGFEVRLVPAVPAREVQDLTGAGDAFLTTWTLGSIAGGPFGSQRLTSGRALRLAAVVASLTVEGVGLPGLPGRADLARRLRELHDEPGRQRSAGG